MTCKDCGWLEVNPGGAMFCSYSDERTWENESCRNWKIGIHGLKSFILAWKDKDEPKTNADRIRAMSDEELADILKEVQLNMVKAYGNDDPLLAGELQKYWLDWLRQET